jgi:hypothetical protein
VYAPTHRTQLAGKRAPHNITNARSKETDHQQQICQMALKHKSQYDALQNSKAGLERAFFSKAPRKPL